MFRSSATPITKDYSHKRIKPKTRPMNAMEKRHAARVVAEGCMIPFCGRAAQYHHERGKPLRRRDHMLGAPLCPLHHTDGPSARHKMDLDDFNEHHGIDIDARAHSERDKSLAMEGMI